MAIADQMAQNPAAPAGPHGMQQTPGGQQPAGAQDIANGDPEEDPGFVKAMNFARKQLYEGTVGEKLHKMAKGEGGPVEPLSALGYQLIGSADRASGGDMLEENIVPLATYILEELVEIYETGGQQVTPPQIADIFKNMLTRFLKESGIDSLELEQAMAQVTPEDFEKVNEAVLNYNPQEEAPVGQPPVEEGAMV